ncbi:hypothetical protein VKT23_013683 [Stygiomarasmius scandens]|uniref:Serine protease inhibitor n=1 Tax=Marasmiellus scandens TaxID=2682957 RepID=A0ABR1J4V9_9AGAR
MSLPSGTYIIRNGDKNVGRRLAEDKSLLPKQVVLLPDGQDSTWEIENIGNDGYLLKNRNSPTANINDQVAALLIDQESAEKWHLEAVPQHGENRYIITTQDQSKGWVAPEESNEQIKCQPLISTRSFPPLYLPTEVFEIVPA